MITYPGDSDTIASTAPRDSERPFGLLGEQRYVTCACGASIASGSMSQLLIETGTGTSAFIRANVPAMGKVGTECATRSPGSASARKAESKTSSEPQPVTIMSGVTPRYSAIAD